MSFRSRRGQLAFASNQRQLGRRRHGKGRSGGELGAAEHRPPRWRRFRRPPPGVRRALPYRREQQHHQPLRLPLQVRPTTLGRLLLRTQRIYTGCADACRRGGNICICIRWWQGFLIGPVLYSAWSSPFELALDRAATTPVVVASLVMDAFFAADIAVSFFVAYFDRSANLFVDDRRKIATR